MVHNMEPVVQTSTNSTRNGGIDSSEKAIDAQIEQEQYEPREVVPTRGGFAYKAKRHCARFWWFHLISFCVGFLIISLCLVYVAMPKIARDNVRDSTLTITELQFLQSEPETLVITQKATIHNPSFYTPTLDAFSVQSYLVSNGTYGAASMLDIPMPKIHVLKNVNVSSDGALVTIDSLDAVTDYCIAVLTQENVTSALVGKTNLHLGHLPKVSINYNKTTTYKGLNGLKGFNVTDVKLNLSATAGEPNLFGTAFIPNPSVLTIEMGNVTLSISTAKEGIVGNSTILNMTLRPGDNYLPMTGIMDQTSVVKSFDPTLGVGIVELFITGTSSVRNGQHLTYYEKALGHNQLTLQMNVTQVIADTVAAAAA